MLTARPLRSNQSTDPTGAAGVNEHAARTPRIAGAVRRRLGSGDGTASPMGRAADRRDRPGLALETTIKPSAYSQARAGQSSPLDDRDRRDRVPARPAYRRREIACRQGKRQREPRRTRLSPSPAGRPDAARESGPAARAKRSRSDCSTAPCPEGASHRVNQAAARVAVFNFRSAKNPIRRLWDQKRLRARRSRQHAPVHRLKRSHPAAPPMDPETPRFAAVRRDRNASPEACPQEVRGNGRRSERPGRQH